MAASKAIVNSVVKSFSGIADAALSLFSALVAASLILYGGYALYDTLYIQNQAYASSWDVLKYRPEIIDDDSVPLTSALASKNKDYRAWLTVYETGIDYPVMQGKDDLYYSSHDVFKKSSLTGALYLACKNASDFSDNYNIIYGHHMDAEALFGSLDNFTKDSYVKSHREGILVTKTSVFDLNIFAVVKTTAYEGKVYTVGNRNLSEVVSFIKANASYFDAATANSATKIVAMSTCEKADTNGRLVVFASLTERDMGGNPTVPSTTDTPDTPDDTITGEDPATEPDTSDANDNGTDDGEEPTATTTTTTGGTPTGGTATRTTGTATGNTADNGTTPAAEEKAEEKADEQPEPEVIEDEETPLAGVFRPTGGSFDTCWALLNLLCVIVSLFMLLPLGSLRAKYRRAKKMDEANAQGENYERDRFQRRLMIGAILEVAVVITSAVVFVFTEDLGGRMALIDMWTPLMLVFPIIALVIDIRLARYREDNDDTDDENRTTPDATQTAAVGA